MISVLVSTRNRPALLRQALASIAAQTRRDFEVLVLNDGGVSPDLTGYSGMILKGFDLPARGQSATLNHGIAQSAGQYLTVAEDDDLMLPRKLAVLGAALDAADLTVGAVYSLPQYTDVRGAHVDTPPRLRRYLEAHPTVAWEDVQASGFFVHGTGTMYRRTALESVGGWDEGLTTAEEYDLHLRLLYQGWTFAAVDAVTVTYRQHPGGKSQAVKRRRGMLRKEALARIYAKFPALESKRGETV